MELMVIYLCYMFFSIWVIMIRKEMTAIFGC